MMIQTESDAVLKCYRKRDFHSLAYSYMPFALAGDRPGSRLVYSCLLRSGGLAGAEQTRKLFGSRGQGSDLDGWWHGVLLRFIFGEEQFATLVRLAATPQQKCQLHYYHGVQLHKSGDIQSAYGAFQSSAGAGADCIERELALAEWDHLSTDTTVRPSSKTSDAGWRGRLNIFKGARPEPPPSDAVDALEIAAYRWADDMIGSLISTPLTPAQRAPVYALARQLIAAKDASGQLPRAAVPFARALIRSWDKKSGDLYFALQSLAIFLMRNAQRDPQGLAESATVLEETLSIAQESIPSLHVVVCDIKTNLAAAYAMLGKPDAAATINRQLIETSTTLFGAEHPRTLAIIGNLAGNIVASGDFDGAERLFQDVHRVALKANGPEHVITLRVLANLASIAYRRGDADGEQRLKDVEQTSRRVLGDAHPLTASIVQRRLNAHQVGYPILYEMDR